MKKCTRCGKDKPLDEFGLRSSVKKGLVPRSYCLICEAEYASGAYKAKKAADPESFNAARRVNKRAQNVKKYGITEDDVLRMGDAQAWMCAICRADIFEHPHIDHDHESGEVRQLLCFHCNVGLGHFYDNVDLLNSAIAYLESHNMKEET